MWSLSGYLAKCRVRLCNIDVAKTDERHTMHQKFVWKGKGFVRAVTLPGNYESTVLYVFVRYPQNSPYLLPLILGLLRCSMMSCSSAFFSCLGRYRLLPKYRGRLQQIDKTECKFYMLQPSTSPVDRHSMLQLLETGLPTPLSCFPPTYRVL